MYENVFLLFKVRKQKLLLSLSYGDSVCMNIFEIDISYLNNNYSSIETFFAGAIQAFSFAIPVSVPLLICLRRLLVEGIPAGIASYLGTTLGQTFFIFMVLGGFREYIQFWYDWEPVLYLIGMLLTLKVLFSFYIESRLKRPSLLNTKTLFSFCGVNFILVICNPVNAINLSRFITNNDLIGMDLVLPIYLLGFFTSLLSFSCLFGLGFYFLRNWLLLVSVKPYSLFMKPVNQGLVIFSLALIFNATGKLTWQLFTYHTAESIVNSDKPLRKFPVFDTGTRCRDRPISVSSRFPLKVLIQRRTWMNKPPLTKNQEEQVYFRYNIHIVNRFSDWVRKINFTSRTPFVNKNTPEQIRRLKQVKSDYLTLNSIIQENTNSKGLKRDTPNRGKGKPPASYTLDTPVVLAGTEQIDLTKSSTPNYLHPDLLAEKQNVQFMSLNPLTLDSFHHPFRFTSEGKYTNSNLIQIIDKNGR